MYASIVLPDTLEYLQENDFANINVADIMNVFTRIENSDK